MSGVVASLEAALDAVLSEPLSCLSVGELAERACALERVASKLEAARCAALAAAEASPEAPGVLRSLGYRSVGQLVADRVGVDPKPVRLLSRTGTWLADFPLFADAFAGGGLTHRHVEELRKLDAPDRHEALIAAQQTLVEAAAGGDFEDFLRAGVYWLHGADSDGSRAKEQVSRTGCSYRTHADGSVSGRFFLDPLAGQAFRKAMDAEGQRLFRADAEAGVARSPWQRGGAALVTLTVKGAESARDGSVTPLVNVVLGHKLAENLIAQLVDSTTDPISPDYHDLERRCELDDGTPIHPHLAAVALAGGLLRRVVFDAASRPVDVSVRSRGFPPWMKELLMLQARGRCRAPGCDAPFAWLQVDHIVPHARGGPTRLSNGQILCDPHNKWKRDKTDGDDRSERDAA